MDNLYFFPKTNTLCWVAGYTADGNTDSVVDIIASIKQTAEKFSEIASVHLSDVKTALIEKSSRFKYMRVFFACVDEPPTSAFVINNPCFDEPYKWLQD